jgi:membrane-associated PAP2 superfamily phosphatase
LRWLLAPLLIAIAALAIGEATDIDRSIMRLIYDVQSAAFPLRYNFWLDVVLHHWTKYAVMTLGCLVLAALVLSFVLPGFGNRRVLLFLLLALSLAPLSVTVGKAISYKHCPWDVDEFGGLVPYTRLFAPHAEDVEPGHCFPAGHASTGFALMAFYFAGYALRRPRAARIALWTAVAAGLVLGAGRVLQGAHFVSHVVWAGVFCWVVMVLLYVLVLEPKSRRAGRTPLPSRSNPAARPARSEAPQDGIPRSSP